MPELIRIKGCVNYDANNVEPPTNNSAFVEIRMLQRRRVNDLMWKNPRAINLTPRVQLGAEK